MGTQIPIILIDAAREKWAWHVTVYNSGKIVYICIFLEKGTSHHPIEETILKHIFSCNLVETYKEGKEKPKAYKERTKD